MCSWSCPVILCTILHKPAPVTHDSPQPRHECAPTEDEQQQPSHDSSEPRRDGDRRFLIFDTETSGFRGSVCQLAYVVFSEREACETLRYAEYWALPHGERMDPRAVAVHGITAEFLEEHGRPPFEDVLRFHRLFREIVDSGGTRKTKHRRRIARRVRRSPWGSLTASSGSVTTPRRVVKL